jgi:hypothetical protein
MLGLNVYCGSLLTESVPCASHNGGRKMVCNIGPVNGYEAQSAIVPFAGIIIIIIIIIIITITTTIEYELRIQYPFILLVGRVATPKGS